MFRKYKTPRGRAGQSTVEYIVLVTAVIATVIFFVAPGKNGKSAFQTKLSDAYNNATEGMSDKAVSLKDSHGDTITGKPTQYSFNAVSSLVP